MKTFMILTSFSFLFSLNPAHAGTSHYHAAQKYLIEKLSNPKISNHTKKLILNQALKNSLPAIQKLSVSDRYLAESIWSLAKTGGDQNQWDLIVLTLKQAEDFL